MCVHCAGGGGGSDGKKVRLDSLATETEDDESHQQQKKRKKNRQHKKWDWEAALRNLQLRVMSKYALLRHICICTLYIVYEVCIFCIACTYVCTGL